MYDFFSSGIDSSQIAGLKSKVDFLHSLVLGKYAQEAINYVGGNGFYSQASAFQEPFQQQSNSFSRNYGVSSYQAPPAPTHKSRLEAMMEQFLEGQQQMITVSFNSKIDALYENLNGKFESLSTHMKELDAKVARTAGYVQRPDGYLPGLTDANPKYQCNAVTLRSGKKLFPAQKKQLSLEEIVEIEEMDDEICGIRNASIDAPKQRSMQSENEEPVVTKSPSNDRYNASYDRRKATAESSRPEKPKQSTERVYKPKVPYPKNHRKAKNDNQYAKCKEIDPHITKIKVGHWPSPNLSLYR
ncbi:hypothetical protein U6M95_12550 [Cutibacterium acnes]